MENLYYGGGFTEETIKAHAMEQHEFKQMVKAMESLTFTEKYLLKMGFVKKTLSHPVMQFYHYKAVSNIVVMVQIFPDGKVGAIHLYH